MAETENMANGWYQQHQPGRTVPRLLAATASIDSAEQLQQWALVQLGCSDMALPTAVGDNNPEEMAKTVWKLTDSWLPVKRMNSGAVLRLASAHYSSFWCQQHQMAMHPATAVSLAD